MPNLEFQEILHFSTTGENLYNTILSSTLHTALTQSKAVIDPKPGGKYTAYDGYIHGTILELHPYNKIVKTWIATEEDWPEGHESVVVFEFEETASGTQLRFTHSQIPEGMLERFREGWKSYYWEPLEKMFN